MLQLLTEETMKLLHKLFQIIMITSLLTPFSSVLQAETAIFAGGCFWCVESDFQDLPGVQSAVSGYTGGHTKNPTYRKVTHGNTGHYEAVEITFDEKVISYDELLKHYWKNIDPLDNKGQFCDKGDSYLSAIFTQSKRQMRSAQNSKMDAQKKLLDNLDKPATIITPILEASTFYPAEDYHQDYYKVNPKRYKYYRWRCGRDDRLEELWD